ncbi:MAG: hypothetical protein ACREOZ_03985, partial [Gloeomargaritales cyanobacterium]
IYGKVERQVQKIAVYAKQLQSNPKKLYSITQGDENKESVTVPFLAFVPTMWAKFFLEEQRTPGEGYMWIQQCISSANSPELNIAAIGLQGWLRAASITRNKETELTSTMAFPWKTIHLDNALVKWGKQRMQMLVPTNAKKQLKETSIHESAENFIEKIAAAYFQGAGVHSSYKETTTRGITKITESEQDRLLGWCGLKRIQVHLLPPIWEKISKERNKAGVRAIVSAALKPKLTGHENVSIHLNAQLVNDIMTLNFGAGMEAVHENCHQGISPFATAPTTAGNAVLTDREDDAQAKATHRTVSDIKQATRKIPSVPPSLEGCLRYILHYEIFLETIFLEHCAHY